MFRNNLNTPCYLESAAQDCGEDLNLWRRYLRKYITFSSCKISESLKDKLLNSQRLSFSQKRILKEALHKGSAEYTKICNMSVKRQGQGLKTRNFSDDDIVIKEEVFKALNDRLAEADLHLDIVCAGGFVLQTLGIRTTMDVDAFFRTNRQVESIIEDVGEEFGINEDEELWLNNSIENLNRLPKRAYWEPYKKFSNLNVYTVNPEYLVGMKLEAGRENDQADAAAVIQKLGLTDPIAFYKKLRRMGFRIDSGDVIFAFAQALGTTWWKDYTKSHWQEISALA